MTTGTITTNAVPMKIEFYDNDAPKLQTFVIWQKRDFMMD